MSKVRVTEEDLKMLERQRDELDEIGITIREIEEQQRNFPFQRQGEHTELTLKALQITANLMQHTRYLVSEIRTLLKENKELKEASK